MCPAYWIILCIYEYKSNLSLYDDESSIAVRMKKFKFIFSQSDKTIYLGCVPQNHIAITEINPVRIDFSKQKGVEILVINLSASTTTKM